VGVYWRRWVVDGSPISLRTGPAYRGGMRFAKIELTANRIVISAFFVVSVSCLEFPLPRGRSPPFPCCSSHHYLGVCLNPNVYFRRHRVRVRARLGGSTRFGSLVRAGCRGLRALERHSAGRVPCEVCRGIDGPPTRRCLKGPPGERFNPAGFFFDD
jgi:hypothetical protein